VKEQPSKPIQLTRVGLLICGIFALGAFLRVYQLSEMAYHHDESLHAYYSYKLFHDGRQEYRYDPVYHGPFLYHYTALIYALFGDSDFTGRLPQVTFGLLIFFLVLRLRPWIGTPGVVCTLIAVALSPTLTYFSRFARNDILIAGMTLGIVVFAMDYIRTRQPLHLVGSLFFLGLMYCCKENSLITGFILCSYLVFFGVYYIFSRPKEARKIALYTVFGDYAPLTKSLVIYGLFSFFAFFYSKVIIGRIDWSDVTGDMTLGVIQSHIQAYLAEHPKFTATWMVLVVLVSAAVFAGMWWIRRWAGGKPAEAVAGRGKWEAIAKENYPLVLGWAIIVCLFCLLFTTLLYNPAGLRYGLVEYYAYWIGQQEHPRIGGPLSYYIPRLFLYEILGVLFGIAAYIYYLVRAIGWGWFLSGQIVFFGALRQFYAYIHGPAAFRENLTGHILELVLFVALGGLVLAGYKIIRLILLRPAVDESRPYPSPYNDSVEVDGYRLFLVYWSIVALIIYSILNEKVPWLMTHQALPICLLAGVFAGDLWRLPGRGAARKAVMAAFVILAIYSLRTNILLNIYNPDNPREIMVYTQSTPDVVRIRDEVEHIAHLLGKDKFMARRDNERSRYQNESSETLVATQGEAQWPFVWYFRHYRTTPGMPVKPLPPVIIVDPNMDTQMQTLAGGKYTVRKYPIRAWWPPYGKTVSPFAAINDPDQPSIKSASQAWGWLAKYMWTREVWSPPGSSDMLVYVRKDLLKEVPAPKVDEGYSQAPQTLVRLAAWGSKGTGPGQFQMPKGVTISPDGQLIYVLDSGNCRIQVLDVNGNFMAQCGSAGRGPGQFNPDYGGPCGGIALGGNGHIFATDTWGNRILIFGQDADPVDAWTQAGPGGTYFGPRGLAVAPDGKVVVADTGHHCLIFYGPDGKYLNTVGSMGAGPGQFTEPVGVAVSADGEIYVADVGNLRIQVLGPDGMFRRQWNILGWTEDPNARIWVEPYIALGPNGSVYVTDSIKGMIHRFNQSGGNVRLGVVAGGFGAPKGIACDKDDNLYVVDAEQHRIIKTRF